MKIDGDLHVGIVRERVREGGDKTKQGRDRRRGCKFGKKIHRLWEWSESRAQAKEVCFASSRLQISRHPVCRLSSKRMSWCCLGFARHHRPCNAKQSAIPARSGYASRTTSRWRRFGSPSKGPHAQTFRLALLISHVAQNDRLLYPKVARC